MINKVYDLYKIILLINNDLTKRFRFTLGNKLETNLLECIENISLAKNCSKAHKSIYILKALSKVEILNLELRLIIDLKLTPDQKNLTKIFQAQAHLNEAGRMLGGWLKASYTQ